MFADLAAWMGNKFDAIVAWVVTLVKAVFGAVWTFLNDFVLSTLELVLNAVTNLLFAVVEPCFFTSVSLVDLLNGLPEFTKYVFSFIDIAHGFAILLCGFLFRMARKALTLGQW